MLSKVNKLTLFLRHHKEFLFFSLMTLLGGVVLFYLNYLQLKNNIYHQVHHDNKYVFELIKKEIHTKAEQLKVTLHFLANNPTLQKEFFDAYNTLQKIPDHQFSIIKNKLHPYHMRIDQFISKNWANSFEQLSHLQIHLAPNNIALYRINDVSFFGDELYFYRPMAVDVIKNGNPQEGLSSKYLSNLYRVILPIKNFEQVIGSIELSFSLKQLIYHFNLQHKTDVSYQITSSPLKIKKGNNNLVDIFTFPILFNHQQHFNLLFKKNLQPQFKKLHAKMLKISLFFLGIFILLNIVFTFLLKLYTNGLNKLINEKTADLQRIITLEKITRKELATRTKEALINQKYAEIGELASGLSHEIKNPLMIIQSSLTHLILVQHKIQDEEIQERIAKTIKISKKNIKRIVEIIDALKIYTRDDNQEMFKQNSLNHIIQTAENLTKPLLRHKKVKLLITSESDVSLECREAQMVQVLVNMINNSAEAIEKLDKRWIHISVKATQDKLSIILQDSGHGIPQEIRDKIFFSFFSTKETGYGTGLGLSLVNNIIRQHNGKISILENEKHTSFEITLPRYQNFQSCKVAA